MNQIIHDKSRDRKYFHQVPNLIDDMDLDLFEHRLYCHYKRVCGATEGECYETVRTTARKTHMSIGKVSGARRTLEARGLIRCEGTNPISITIVDIWPHNVAWFSQERPEDETPPQDVHHMNLFTTRTNVHHMNENCSRSDTKEEPIKKNHIKNNQPLSGEALLDHLGIKSASKARKKSNAKKHIEEKMASLDPEERALYIASGGAAEDYAEFGEAAWTVPPEAGGADSFGEELYQRFCDCIKLGALPKKTKIQFIRHLSKLAQTYLELGAGEELILEALEVSFLKDFIRTATRAPFFGPFEQEWSYCVSRALDGTLDAYRSELNVQVRGDSLRPADLRAPSQESARQISERQVEAIKAIQRRGRQRVAEQMPLLRGTQDPNSR